MSSQPPGQTDHETATPATIATPAPVVTELDPRWVGLEDFIDQTIIPAFFTRRTEKIKALNFHELVSRKNPYLYRAKDIGTPERVVWALFSAYLSSQEETIFGNLMEELAIHVCGIAYEGRKAEQKKFRSIDLFFERDKVQYVVGIKSGPNWGNSDQQGGMKRGFAKAEAQLRGEGVTLPIMFVNGCAYGRDNRMIQDIDDSGTERIILKVTGEVFWELISGDPTLYVALVHKVKNKVRQRQTNFDDLCDSKVIEITKEFVARFVTGDYIDWEAIVRYVSAKEPPNSQLTLGLADAPVPGKRTRRRKQG